MLKNATYKEISYSEFLNMIDENKISKVKFEQDRIIITPSDDTIEDTAMGKIKYTYYTAYINDDELVEVTPKNIRLRKRLLTENERRKAYTKKMNG